MAVSLYLVLADQLTARIQGGHYPSGSALPTAYDLEHEGHPVRVARDALRWLVKHGWAEAGPGGALHVAADTHDHGLDWDHLTSVVDSLVQGHAGLRPASSLMLNTASTASSTAASAPG
ncbi:helix-turn-helix domain-containing protein [Kineosporia succinea]|uniref:DNA-binding FadR family transcriptional regulator n=1 Tax=Kineosporia succinea TaxID=84632 RepID=A0ABT9PD88_9ACTN|nr:hypothetical protein [Kineosporia succinea]MDP9830681.1 DNA-binding FadR family transcriptional regulator [Kineosporia succinea]